MYLSSVIGIAGAQPSRVCIFESGLYLGRRLFKSILNRTLDNLMQVEK